MCICLASQVTDLVLGGGRVQYKYIVAGYILGMVVDRHWPLHRRGSSVMEFTLYGSKLVRVTAKNQHNLKKLLPL